MDPRHAHLVAKHAVRYLKDTVEYDTNHKTNLHGYFDLDWECISIYRKSTLGCYFSMGLVVISWFRRKQSCMALSTAKRGAVKLQYVIQIEISRKMEF